MSKTNLGEWLPLLLEEIDRKNIELDHALQERDRRLQEKPSADQAAPDAPSASERGARKSSQD